MPDSLAIVTFLYGQPKKWRDLLYDPYCARHVNALWRACEDNIKIPHRFIAYTDKPNGIKCERRQSFDVVSVRRPDSTLEDGCYQRLRMYDPEVQAEIGADHILILDLDMVFTGDCTELIEKCMEHDFTALRGSVWPDGTPCSWYNGSFQMCRAGARPQFWHEFDTERFYQQREAYRMPGGRRPHGTDQAWLTVCAGPDEHTIWTEDGVHQYRNSGTKLPDSARMVFFAGRDKPWFPSVAAKSPGLAQQWRKYADNGNYGRALIIGRSHSVWPEVEKALDRHKRFDGVIALREPAKHWPGPIDATATDDDHALELARMMGFADVVFCGRTEKQI